MHALARARTHKHQTEISVVSLNTRIYREKTERDAYCAARVSRDRGGLTTVAGGAAEEERSTSGRRVVGS